MTFLSCKPRLPKIWRILHETVTLISEMRGTLPLHNTPLHRVLTPHQARAEPDGAGTAVPTPAALPAGIAALRQLLRISGLRGAGRRHDPRHDACDTQAMHDGTQRRGGKGDVLALKRSIKKTSRIARPFLFRPPPVGAPPRLQPRCGSLGRCGRRAGEAVPPFFCRRGGLPASRPRWSWARSGHRASAGREEEGTASRPAPTPALLLQLKSSFSLTNLSVRARSGKEYFSSWGRQAYKSWCGFIRIQ